MTLAEQIEQAMWDGDENRLHELAPCICCCGEHTFREGCPAWAWAGCRGYGSTPPMTMKDAEGWAKHYGITVDEFFANGAGE